MLKEEEEDTLLGKPNQPENPNSFNINERQSSDKEQQGSDKAAFALLGGLFFIESLPLGLFGASIPLILIERGASFLNLAELSIMALPYILKIFLAPLFDSAKSHSYGKRKRFLIPALLSGGAILILISFWLDNIVQNSRIHYITLVGFLIILISAILDIITNGWVVSLVSTRNFALVPTVHKVASTVGVFISFNAFIPLNSVEFCNKYIYSEPRDTPIFTLSGFALVSGIVYIAATILLHFFHEKEFPEEHHATFHEIKEALKLFWRNPKLKLLALQALFCGFGISPVLAIFLPIMIQQGIAKEIVANLSTALIPIGILSVIAIGFINKKYKQEIKVLAISHMCSICYVLIPIYSMIYLHVQTDYNEALYLLVALSALVTITAVAKTASWQGFCYRIAHESMATTFLVILFSLKLLGTYWPSLIALLIGDYVSFTVIAIVSIGCAIAYIIFLWKKIVPLQDLTAKE